MRKRAGLRIRRVFTPKWTVLHDARVCLTYSLQVHNNPQHRKYKNTSYTHISTTTTSMRRLRIVCVLFFVCLFFSFRVRECGLSGDGVGLGWLVVEHINFVHRRQRDADPGGLSKSASKHTLAERLGWLCLEGSASCLLAASSSTNKTCVCCVCERMCVYLCSRARRLCGGAGCELVASRALALKSFWNVEEMR